MKLKNVLPCVSLVVSVITVLPSTVEKYYISSRTKKIWNGEIIQVVEIPENKKEETG